MTRARRQRYFRFILLGICLICSLLPAACRQQESPPESAQVAATPAYDGTIIAVGDSLTAGLGMTIDEAWPALLERKLIADGYNWQVINAGISGETSSGVLSRIKWIISRKPDIVILETGANDGLRGIPPDLIRENIDKAVQMLVEGKVTVILAGMQMVSNLGEEYTGSFAAIYPEIAEKHRIPLIPFLLRDVAGIPALNQADTIHPNAAGHRIIAETVFPFVVQAIEKNR